MNKVTRLIVSGSALALAAGTLAGCTINIGVPGADSDRRQHGMMDSQQNSAGFSKQDLMFAQMMIPHHEQAVEMSTLAETRSTNPEVLALAKQIKAAQQPEIEQMQGWLDASGVSATEMDMDHMGHGMGGMLSTEQMDALENASGAAFDKLYLEGMIEHHEGAIQMAHMITDSSNTEARELGDAIVKTQTAEIAKMKQLLTTLA